MCHLNLILLITLYHIIRLKIKYLLHEKKLLEHFQVTLVFHELSIKFKQDLYLNSNSQHYFLPFNIKLFKLLKYEVFLYY